MMAIELCRSDIYNQKTIQRGHPPGWPNRKGGEYDLVVLGGGPAWWLPPAQSPCSNDSHL
jgi:hypothetical protein